MTSTDRTAGCGPACPVVWQGNGGSTPAVPYADVRPPHFSVSNMSPKPDAVFRAPSPETEGAAAVPVGVLSPPPPLAHIADEDVSAFVNGNARQAGPGEPAVLIPTT